MNKLCWKPYCFFVDFLCNPQVSCGTLAGAGGDIIQESDAIVFYKKDGGYNSDIQAKDHYGRMWDVTNYLPGTVMGSFGKSAKENLINNYLKESKSSITAKEHIDAVTSAINNIVSAKEMIQEVNNAAQQAHNLIDNEFKTKETGERNGVKYYRKYEGSGRTSDYGITSEGDTIIPAD